MSVAGRCARCAFSESRSLGLERNAGGKLHLKLHMGSRPIANKYHEGKVKRTLKRKVKVLEIAEHEVSEATMFWRDCCTSPPLLAASAYVWQ